MAKQKQFVIKADPGTKTVFGNEEGLHIGASVIGYLVIPSSYGNDDLGPYAAEVGVLTINGIVTIGESSNFGIMNADGTVEFLHDVFPTFADAQALYNKQFIGKTISLEVMSNTQDRPAKVGAQKP